MCDINASRMHIDNPLSGNPRLPLGPSLVFVTQQLFGLLRTVLMAEMFP